MYKLFVKPLVFCLKPEESYKLFLRFLKFSNFLFGPQLIRITHKCESPSLSKEVFGINFKNPVGLAAGFDINGDYADYLADYGFGFIEIGSLSPHRQNGFEKPRVFRYSGDKTVINRMGGKNNGVKNAIGNINGKRSDCILAVNIIPDSTSKKDEEVIRDYQTVFSLMYDFADMFTVNISMPNESGILTIQDETSLADIVDPLLDLRLCYDTYKPLLIKVSPDIPYERLDRILDYCMLSGVDGIIAGGPTRKREGLDFKSKKILSRKTGCLSGAPLYPESLALVKHISEHTKGHFPIIGCGGIMTPLQADEMLGAGASLIQMHTGILFEGPKLVKKILKHLTLK